MANNLTGDYEAVFQIRLSKINAILATLHQAQLEKDPKISFPHSASIYVGDSPIAKLFRERVQVSEWALKAAAYLQATTGSADNVRAMLAARVPQGIRPLLEDALRDLDLRVPGAAPTIRSGREPLATGPGVVPLLSPGAKPSLHALERVPSAGRVDCQISNPTVSIPPGSVSQVKVHVRVRARFYRDDDTLVWTAPIHGEITAVYAAAAQPGGVLRVQITSDDKQIEFLDKTQKQQLSAADAQTIIALVRGSLRRQFVALDVPLPADFAFSEFKSLGSGDDEALALPLTLSPGPPPAGALGSVTNHFLGPQNLAAPIAMQHREDFAVAVSKEYLQGFFDGMLRSLPDGFTASGLLGSVTYTASPWKPVVTWSDKIIRIDGSIHMYTDSVAPDFDISFGLKLEVVLDPGAVPTVSIRPVGDPEGKISLFFVKDDNVVSQVKSLRDSALPKASALLDARLADARNKLASALATLDPSARAAFTALDVTADGIIVRGVIATSGRADAIVSYGDVDGGTLMSAGSSWIPGGRIDSFVWNWWQSDSVLPLPWRGTNEQREVFDDFLWERTPEAIASGRVCLQIKGSRRTADGTEESGLVWGEVCTIKSSGPPVGVPPWKQLLYVPDFVNAPDPAPDFGVSQYIAGHVSLVDDNPEPGRLKTNMLVYFTGLRGNRPLEGVARAIATMRRRDAPLCAVLVLPTGTLDGRRSEIEERLGSPGERFGAELVITEDYLGGWSRAFAVAEGPSTHLMNALGEFVWRRDGELDPAAIARALDEHALPAPPPQKVPIRLGVSPGARPRDTVFTDERWEHTSLRRLRGRRILLVFWQSWSSPCLRELRRLAESWRERDAPFVLAVNGGEAREVMAEVRRTHGLPFPLIQDPERRIAELYGVRYWPTTVSINEVGIVDRVQLGLTHAPRTPRPSTTATAPARR